MFIFNFNDPYTQVYEEKERAWEREISKMKGLYENRLKANQQKNTKIEEALMNQTLQVYFLFFL